MIAIVWTIILLPLALIAVLVDLVRFVGSAIAALCAAGASRLRSETMSHLPAAR